MTIALQFFVFVAAIAGLVGFGFYRDEKEHASVIRVPRRTSTE